jgi:hypothetical protein
VSPTTGSSQSTNKDTTTTVSSEDAECDDEANATEEEEEEARATQEEDEELTDEELLDYWGNKEANIEHQKKRVIAHWNEALTKNDKLLEMNDAIVEKLQHGLVPPAFHAFSADTT